MSPPSQVATVAPPDPPEQLLISAPEVAKILGISTRSVWRLRSAGKIVPPIEIGGLVRWKKADILAWIDQDCPDHASISDERT